jgi:hypothetical protein
MLYDHLAANQPFEWGTNDCVLWCADWVQKIIGVDYAADFRGKYASDGEASAIMQAAGFASIADLVSAHLPEVTVNKARRGDIVLHPMGMVGICDGAHAHFLTVGRPTQISFTLCTNAWSVG